MGNRLFFTCKVLFIKASVLALIAGVFAGVSYSGELTKKALTRTNSEAAVSIRATFLNPIQEITEGELVFEIRMNTHAVNLDRYQMEKLILLKDDEGHIYRPLGWYKPGGGGHHRFGMVKFSDKREDGSKVLDKETESITLLIKEIAGVKERSFIWDFPLR